jgi:hydrogenase-1 operon protein HyaF
VEAAAGGPPSAQVLAIASEIEQHLARLLSSGQNASIDLRSLPLAPGDYEALQALLGEGEVSARLDSLGPSSIYETAVPGVWWTVHRNANEEVMADLIEITDCPEIIKTQQADLAEAVARLRARTKQADIGEH